MKWMVHGTCACCWYANGRIISQHVYFCLFDKKNSNKEKESDNTCKNKSTQESQNPVITIYWLTVNDLGSSAVMHEIWWLI